MGNNTTSTPSIYKPQSFSKEHQLYAKYGSTPSRRQLRQFNKYWESDQRHFDEILHDRREFDKMFESGYRNLEYLRNKYKPKPITTTTNAPATSLENKYKDKIKINDYWTKVAKSKGFASMYEVAEWQSKNGLYVDGKFGNKSEAFYKSQQKTNTKSKPAARQPEYKAPSSAQTFSAQTSSPVQSTGYVGNAATSTTNSYRGTSLKPAYSLEDLQNSTYFKKTTGGGSIRLNTHTNRDYILVEGVPYAVIETTGEFNRNPSGILPYDWYAYNPGTGLVRRLNVSWGTPYSGRAHDSKYGSIEDGTWAEGSEWRNPKILFDNLGYVTRSNPKAPSVAEVETPATNYIKRNFYKNGGTMNRINYFQQGGAAPQQDIQQQVEALVQAAAQGDEQATQQITQIMEAAKSGNKQAIQLAQMIQQTIEKMKSQATAAKWGAKLGYIKSLKYAKGGKTCPACEKKVEMKACGGKKAKKHYFGGLI